MNEGMEVYREAFLAESAEFLCQITDALLLLESNPNDTAPVEEVFRGAHSLKGMAAAMGYDKTAEVTHRMESLVDLIRKHERIMDSATTDVLLAAVDFVRELIEDESGEEGALDTTEILQLLADVPVPIPEDSDDHDEEEGAPGGELLACREGEELHRIVVSLESSCVLKAVRAYMVIKRLGHVGAVVGTEPSARDIEDEKFEQSFVVLLSSSCDEGAIREAVLGVTEVESVAVAVVDAPSEVELETSEHGQHVKHKRAIPKISETQTVRVAIGHLDTMVDLVGELVILRSRLNSLVSGSDSMALMETVERMGATITELQHEVFLTRMVPVDHIFNRFPRMVRDLARDLGKEIVFEMDGLDIELDRTVLDEIGDPLVHLLRNSIDHGIEDAETRVSAGKPRSGRVMLSAARERDNVLITVSDDGRGMDPERIWSKAVERGVVPESSRDIYNTDDIYLLTCVPGFTTAMEATRISGRGVGMDAVKGKIEHLGGTLAIHSRPGRGSDFVLRVPLTLAIIQALLVTCRGQTFAIPLSSVNEVTVPEDITVASVDGVPVAVLDDGTPVTIWRLDSLLFGARSDRPVNPGDRLVLMEVFDEPRMLLVDEFLGRHEIVVKPLSKVFQSIRGLGGATVLGNGQVALIVDPRSIFTDPEDSR